MNNLKIKDLINIGIFFAIYFVVFFTIGFMGLVPLLFLVYPTVAAIVVGPIVMLFMAKVPKKWALFIFGMLGPMIMFVMGHTFVVPLVALIFVSLAEFFFRKGEFKSFKYIAISYAFFSVWISGSLMQMFLAKEQYKAIHTAAGMPTDYFDKLDALISVPSMALLMIGAFIGGLIGAYLGRLMLKKHFEKAGIV